MSETTLLKPVTQTPTELVPPRLGLDKPTTQEAARLFEGMVMVQMFQAMRKTIHPSGLFGDDTQTRSTYEYLLDQAVVEHAMASGKGLGLSDHLEKTLEAEKNNSSLLS